MGRTTAFIEPQPSTNKSKRLNHIVWWLRKKTQPTWNHEKQNHEHNLQFEAEKNSSLKTVVGQGLVHDCREYPVLTSGKTHFPLTLYLSTWHLLSSHVGVRCLLVPQASSSTQVHQRPQCRSWPWTAPGTIQCFYGYCIAFLIQALHSFHVACPLPQKARWQNVCDSITDPEMPLPLQGSLLSIQRLFSISGLLESCPGVIHIGKSYRLICNWCQATLSDPESKYLKRLFQEGKGDLEHHYLISSIVILPSSPP